MDWLVADSEDEDQLVESSTTPPGEHSLFTPPDHFTSISSPPRPPEPVLVPRPRPKPRLVMKKRPTADVTGSSFSHISDPSISASKRTNDTIQSAMPASFNTPDAIEDIYSSLDIAERAKMRSRKSQKARIQPAIPMNDVIVLTSDEDELTLKPTKTKKKEKPAPQPKVPTRPRPKPTLKVKSVPALPTGSPSSAMIHDIPPPVPSASSAQLPTSTLPTVPPSTPPQARELTPLSPPLVTTNRKRKRVCSYVADDGDDGLGNIGSTGLAGDSPFSTMPPPFFAPSSSSVPTDSGVEIPPPEPAGRGKKKQGPPGKKATRTKAAKKGNGTEKTGVVDTVEDSTRTIQEQPCTPSLHDNSSFAEDRHSPLGTRRSTTTKQKQPVVRKGKARVVDSSEDEGVKVPSPEAPMAPTLPANEDEGHRSKENLRPDTPDLERNLPAEHSSTSHRRVRDSSINPNVTPMTELIRRVNSQPSSPFPNTTRTYSPFLKSSRTMLSRIAPLHPNRRTPPPPPPRPPPPKKSKKQLEMEERIEEELEETVEGWSCLTDEERKALRKARIDAELGYE